MSEAEREGETPSIGDLMALKSLQLFEGSLLRDGRLREVSEELVDMVLKCEGLPLVCCLEKLLLSVVIMEFGD